MRKRLATYFIFLMAFVSCISRSSNEITTDNYPSIYPDYIDVTLPENIAPLNFMMRDSSTNVIATIKGVSQTITVKGKNKIQIPINKWKALLSENQEQNLEVTVTSFRDGEWIKYKPFFWNVKKSKIDPYLSYRLIEPGYEVWNKIQVVERHIENFDERVLADNNLTEGSCMNCHIYGNQDANLSMMHIRGKKGGTMLNRNGKLRKINTRNNDMIANATYGNIHPSGRFAVFSSNVVIPEFHAYKSERLEVYDKASDLIVLDFDENKISTQPFLSDTTAFETFPVFSADGNWIYYCSAPYMLLPDSIRSLKYSIHKIAFDPETNTLGTKVDTIWDAQQYNGSVSHLKTSPNGKYLLYTVADYGTFPIWHREADLQLMNLESGEIDKLESVNAFCSDSYHSWSSNSSWFVFASKRDNGIYGKPYFSYIDENGIAHKPFVLPQHDPELYDFTLKSFNIPELSKGQTPFDAMDIEKLYRDMETEKVN